MLYKNTMAAFLLVASSAAFTAVAGGMATATNETGRSIGWWWSCPATADDPRVDGMLRWAKEHTHILSTLIMHCGINTCDTNHSAPRGGNFSCLNNGGIGGTVSGELAPSGVRVLPELLKLGIKVELWLGEDDSRQSALHMFQGPAKVAQDLIAVAKAHPGISGFNLDTETAHSTAADAALSVPFLTEVTATLRSAEGGPYRFSTDVACSGGTGWCPMISDCALLARSGVDRIMNMATYNAPDFASWYQTALVPALGTGIPRSKLGAGLGVWNDSRTAHTWNLTPQAAEERICALMNHSVQELDLFILNQGEADPTRNFPYAFWIPQLEKFMAGGGCPLPAGTIVSCPAAGAGMPPNSWKPGGDPGCCQASYNRGAGLSCNSSCAEAECLAAGKLPGESWSWRPENYSSHPYECCNKTVPPAAASMRKPSLPALSEDAGDISSLFS